MMKCLFSRYAVPAAIVAAIIAALPGQALAASTSSARCPNPSVSQQFRSWGDLNWYASAPGEVADSFFGAGWALSGGARVVSAKLADGNTGLVLDLPPGSSASSPVMCVESGEPIARMITRIVGSASSSNATTFYVSLAGSAKLGSGMPVLGKSSWEESPPDNVFPGSGTDDVYFTYKANAKVGDLQVYDLFIDPRMSF